MFAFSGKAFQRPNETLDQYHTRLRTLADPCEFADLDFELEEQIIIGGSSSRLRKQALRDLKYDLKAMLLDGRRDEMSKFQSKEIEGKPGSREETNQVTVAPRKCRNCGGSHSHNSPCPAQGLECHYCGKSKHFAKVCRGKSKAGRMRTKPHHRKPARAQSHKNLKPLPHSDSESDYDEYVNLLALSAVPKAMTMREIQTATNADKVLQSLRAAICCNMWDSDLVKPYKNIKEELTVTMQNVILRGSRIVIPESLQQRAIDLAHDTHQGLVKTKALLREKVCFPWIDRMVKATIDHCISCQATGRPNPPEPLQMSDMPQGPWQKVHADFYGPLPSGEYLLVVIDRCSRYPEVEIVRSTKASSVIPKFDKIFSTHAIPISMTTDNGPLLTVLNTVDTWKF